MEAPGSPVTTMLLMSVAAPVIAVASMIAAALMSTTEASGSLWTTVSPVSATEGSGSKFSGVEVSNRRLRAENQTPLAGVLEDGSSAKLMGPWYVVHSALQH